MTPVHTKIALVVSLIGLGWSSTGTASEAPRIPGPLSPPEPTTPFGVPTWPELWSFDLPVATRSPHADIPSAASKGQTGQAAVRYKAGAAAVAFQDYAFQSQHYVCFDAETGVVARAATGCRMPADVLDDGLVAAEAAASLEALEVDSARGHGSAPRARSQAVPADAAVPREAALRELSGDTAGGEQAAAVESSAAPVVITKSSIQPDLSGIHADDPFSFPDATELAEARERAAAATAATSRPEQAPHRMAVAEAPLADSTVEHHGDRAEASSDPRSQALAADARKDSKASAGATDLGRSGTEAAATAFRPIAQAGGDVEPVLHDRDRSATKILADLSIVHDECPFSLPDAADLARARERAALADAAKARVAGDRASKDVAPPTSIAKATTERSHGSAALSAGASAPAAERDVALVDDKTQRGPHPSADEPPSQLATSVADDAVPALPALDGAYPFWLPDTAAATGAGRCIKAGEPAMLARTEAIDATIDRPAARSDQDEGQLSANAPGEVEPFSARATRMALRRGPRSVGDEPLTLDQLAARIGRTTTTSPAPVERHEMAHKPAEAIADAQQTATSATEDRVFAARAPAQHQASGAAVRDRAATSDQISAEVYGVLAEQYAANLSPRAERAPKATAAGTSTASRGVSANAGAAGTTNRAFDARSVLTAEPAEVYGVLADEALASASTQAAAAVATKSDGDERRPLTMPGEIADGAGTAAVGDSAGSPKQPHAAARIEVDAADWVGRAASELLAAIESWAAKVAKDPPSPHAAAIEPRAEQTIESPFGDGGVAVAAVSLDNVRGGFDDGSGLRIAFGIERAVYVNGNLVTTTNFNVAGVANNAAAQAAAATAANPGGAGFVLIQNGTGNVVHAGLAPSAAATVIQNTLNDQKISSVTLVNATVNSLQLANKIDLQSTLRNVVTDALRR